MLVYQGGRLASCPQSVLHKAHHVIYVVYLPVIQNYMYYRMPFIHEDFYFNVNSQDERNAQIKTSPMILNVTFVRFSLYS